jgi:beta-mannosidase
VLDADVAARSVAVLPIPVDVVSPSTPVDELLVVDGAGLRAFWFFAEDKDLAYPVADFEASVTAGELSAGKTTVDVTVTARTILRDMVLQADRLDPSAEVDRALVTLLPGESTTFRVTADGPLPAEALVRPPVLRCVNDTPRSIPPAVP